METQTNPTAAKARITLQNDGVRYVTFPDGRKFVVRPNGPHGQFDWSRVDEGAGQNWRKDYGSVCSEKYLWDALRTSGVPLPAPRYGSAAELEKAIGMTLVEIDRDQGAFLKTIKKVLAARFGGKWSCRRNSGTAYSWCDVRPSDETAKFWSKAADIEDSIPPTRGYRASALCHAAGVEPEGFTCDEHGWD